MISGPGSGTEEQRFLRKPLVDPFIPHSSIPLSLFRAEVDSQQKGLREDAVLGLRGLWMGFPNAQLTTRKPCPFPNFLN